MIASPSSVPIFLIEDDEVDIEAVRRALQRANIANPFHVAYDGVEALEVLRGENDHRSIPQPCILLVDINLPRMNGLEFVEEVRHDKKLQDNVVFMLTTSTLDNDKKRAYRLNVSGYILKENLSELAL